MVKNGTWRVEKVRVENEPATVLMWRIGPGESEDEAFILECPENELDALLQALTTIRTEPAVQADEGFSAVRISDLMPGVTSPSPFDTSIPGNDAEDDGA